VRANRIVGLVKIHARPYNLTSSLLRFSEEPLSDGNAWQGTRPHLRFDANDGSGTAQAARSLKIRNR